MTLVDHHDDPAGPGGGPGNRDVLVIEDDPLQLSEIGGFLTRSGISVSPSSGGSAGLHNIAEVRPRVAVVDYNLPDVDGMTVAERIHRLSPDTSVILVSGRIDFVPDAVMDKYGVVAFMAKPIGLKALRNMIQKILRHPEKATRARLQSPFLGLFARS